MTLWKFREEKSINEYGLVGLLLNSFHISYLIQILGSSPIFFWQIDELNQSISFQNVVKDSEIGENTQSKEVGKVSQSIHYLLAKLIRTNILKK